MFHAPPAAPRTLTAMARPPVRTTVRIGPKVEHAGHPDLISALLALRERLSAVGGDGETRSVFRREYSPIAQVVARGEVRGPGRARGGVDVRGDRSAEAWTGRYRRELVPQEDGEDAYAALARVLGG